MRQLQLFRPVRDAAQPVPLPGLDILTVGRYLLGDRVSPQPVGPNDKGLCVFHRELTPSFYLKPVPNMYICYGCGRLGGPVSLVLHKAMDIGRAVYDLSRTDVSTEDGLDDLWHALIEEERRFKRTLVGGEARRMFGDR